MNIKKGIKVRYIGPVSTNYLSRDKIYEVINYSSWLEKIRIVDNFGNDNNYFLYGSNNEPLFEDITAEIRSTIIDDILK